MNWSEVYNSIETNEAYDALVNKFCLIYNNCFPLCRPNRKAISKIEKPWITDALLKSIKRKNKLYKRFLSNPNTYNNQKYKTYKNKLTHLLKISKLRYYESKINNTSNNIKQTWKLINEVINKRNSKPKFHSKFQYRNKEISDPTEIANKFCSYFTSVGKNLADQIPSSSVSPKRYLQGNVRESIFFTPATTQEIIDISRTFQSGKAPGYDGIKITTVKQSIYHICEPLTYIINLSLSSGIVPNNMKVARVIPIYKKEDPSLFSNYRPISILPCFSKFLERIIYNRISDFVNKKDILYMHQYGFRKNHSTCLAMLHLIDNITSSLDRKELVMGIFLDLSKAFDTVDHEILFDKLYFYGIRGIALDWVKSYFYNRKQFVQFNKSCSAPQTLVCGVPQGSILGPLFFMLYVNDLYNVSSSLSKILLFADDTNILISHKDPTCLTDIANTELDKINSWFKANKLSLNIKKTNFMIFKTFKKENVIIEPPSIDSKQLERLTQTSFLGVVLDQHLSWKPHISELATKIAKSAGVIFKCRFYLPKKCLLSLYYALVYPYLHYCNLVWGSSYVTNLHRLTLIQKRVVRSIAKAEFLSPSEPIFKELKILKVMEINSLQKGTFMFSYCNNLLPRSYDNLFVSGSQIHHYNTRTAQNPRPHRCRTTLKSQTITYQGPVYWNFLNDNIKMLPNLSQFKFKLKESLLQDYLY